jgi:tetratricopeptide (TPR) repeat protein
VPWAQVKEHAIDNLIALCSNCHSRFDKGEIDRTAIRQYKKQLTVISQQRQTDRPSMSAVAIAGLPHQPVLVGRDIELAQLRAMLQPREAEETNIVPVVSGLAGVGKTALALRAAHETRDTGWFPGGMLSVDLRSYDASTPPVTAAAALTSLLNGLGVPDSHVPDDPQSCGRLWRSLLAERAADGQRMLILIDNASTAHQVQLLLPGLPDHRILVTSRHSLTELSGARLLELAPLTSDHAVRLLHGELAAHNPADHRIATDPTAAVQVVQWCGGLPLAVCICAGLLAAEPEQPLSELATALAGETLTELDDGGNRAVRVAFDVSYQRLPTAPARLFRLLALARGPQVSTAAAAAITDMTDAEARRLLSQLRQAHLIQPATTRGWWSMHDLLRCYAAERARDDPEHDSARERLLDYYLSGAIDAYRHVGPPSAASTSKGHFPTRNSALDWLDAEHHSLALAVTEAFGCGRVGHSLYLQLLLQPYYELRRYWRGWITASFMAISAAQCGADRQTEAGILLGIARAYRGMGQPIESYIHCSEALGIHQQIDDRHGEARALIDLGHTYRDLSYRDCGSMYEARSCYEAALRISRQLGDREAESLALAGLGCVVQRRHPDSALDHHQQSLVICRHLGHRAGEARALADISTTCRLLSRFEEALAVGQQATTIFRDLDDRYGQAQTLINEGKVHQARTEFDAALDRYHQALQLSNELGDHNRGCVVALFNISRAYRAKGMLDDARASWQQAIDAYPLTWGDLKAMTNVRRARALLRHDAMGAFPYV